MVNTLVADPAGFFCHSVIYFKLGVRIEEGAAASRILFIHPMGTDMYNRLTLDLLAPVAAPGTEIEVRHLPGLPETPFVPEAEVWREAFFEAVRAAERDGFDAAVSACSSDPLVKEAKQLVNIPVIGPFEALARTAPSLGGLTIVAGGYKIETWAPRAAAHGLEGALLNIRKADFSHPDPEAAARLFASDVNALLGMVLDEMARALHDDGVEQTRLARDEDGAACVFYACSLWSGMLGAVSEQVPGITVLDPLIMPLKYAEYLAGFRQPSGAQDRAAGFRPTARRLKL